jgi:anti-sigma-K factor RskA
MNCRELELVAIEYVEGVLPASARDALHAHLARCAPCAERVRGLSAVNNLLDGWEGMQPSASFDARLQQRISQQQASQGWQRFADRYLRFPFARPALAGALLSVLLVAVALVRYYPGSSPVAVNQPSPAEAAAAPSADELALYQDLRVLENWELLSNFEVLQELNEATP